MPTQRRLTIDAVHAIRMARGTTTISNLAMRFDRSPALINQIQNGKAYEHVPWTDAETTLRGMSVAYIKSRGAPNHKRNKRRHAILALVQRAKDLASGSQDERLLELSAAFDLLYDAVKQVADDE